jgi:hypothetical protein
VSARDEAGASGFWPRRGVTLAYACGVVLSLPSLAVPLFGDDFLQRLVLEGSVPMLGLDATTLYDFSRGGTAPLIEHGFVPWFTHPDASFRFFRPLGSLSIALDHALFGRSALPSHAVNVALFLGTLWLVTALFRRLLPPARAGLAAFLFAVAGGHMLNLDWVAGRHGPVAGLFGALALLLHVTARQTNDTPRRAPAQLGSWIALLLGLLTSETTLAAFAFIAAYELLAREGPFVKRALGCAPYGAAALGYVALYSALGYGIEHSALYLSPLSDPIAYLSGAVTRLPVLLGEMAIALPAFLWGWSEAARPVLALLGLAASALVGALAYRASGSAAERRKLAFLATAAIAGSLPMVGGVVDGRMLLIPFFSSMPIVAIAIEGAFCASRTAPRRRLLGALGAGVFVLHAAFGGCIRVGGTALMAGIAERQKALALGVDRSRCAAGATSYVVSGADPSLCLSGLTSLLYYRPELEPRLAVLSLAPHDQRVERTADGAVVLHVDDLPRRATIFEGLFRDDPLAAGDRVDLDELSATVLATERGLPTRVRFELPENACLLWLERGVLVGHALPRAGETLRVPHEPGPFGL